MKMNIKELHAEFCQEAQFIRNFRPSTIRGYKDVLCIFLKFSPVEFVEEVTTEKLRTFLYEGRIQKAWTADTFLGYFKRLKSFFKWCVQRGYLTENPILPIEKPRLERKLPKRITKQEAQRAIVPTQAILNDAASFPGNTVSDLYVVTEKFRGQNNCYM